MIEKDCYLSISEFARLAMVSKQAIYKQISNEHSQLAPFVCQQGKRTLIKAEALKALYKVDLENSTLSTCEGLKIQPDTEDYIAFLKAEIADLKEQETRHAEALAEKDRIIQEQAKQLADLCQQVADIAQKALTTTAQQQYLMAYDRKAGEQKPIDAETEQSVADESQNTEQPEREHKGLFVRLKAWFNSV